MTTAKFWPFDMDNEGQIYENPAWDLPGHRPRSTARKIARRPAHKPAGKAVASSPAR